MELLYHQKITTAALSGKMSARALEVVIQANIKQDNLWNLAGGYPEYHFDDSQFEATYAYIDSQKQLIFKALEPSQTSNRPYPEENLLIVAWEALGRITHAVQDFYAHSNYISLWTDRFANHEHLPPPESIEPLVPEILKSPKLMTGRLYFPLEALTVFPKLRPLVARWLPPDSHANLNLDEPSRGELFPYAMVAARKRTVTDFNDMTTLIRSQLGQAILDAFVDM